MTSLRQRQVLPVHEVVASNYLPDSDNVIHGDAGAAKHGFKGALVPGVALFAYMMRPAMDSLGRTLLEHGRMSARFVAPVYDGEKLVARGEIAGRNPMTLGLELIGHDNQTRAVGTALMPEESPVNQADSSSHPWHAPPDVDARRPPTIKGISEGEVFGSLDFALDLTGEHAAFLDDILEQSALFSGSDGLCHPAFLLARSNEFVARNIALGPWVHTASEIQNFAPARDIEDLSLRGRVVEARERRGHELMVFDLALFGEHDRLIARIRHSAIVRLRGDA